MKSIFFLLKNSLITCKHNFQSKFGTHPGFLEINILVILKAICMFFVCFTRLFLDTIIGSPMKMSTLELWILEMAYRCWVRNQRPTLLSSVKPGPNGWLLHRRALCITFSVRGLSFSCLLEEWTYVIVGEMMLTFIINISYE